MTAKVDETLRGIPSLKVTLEDVVNFKDSCLDPIAIEIITQSLDYALETSVRRLESVAKINPEIKENATKTILPIVKTLRDLIEKAPGCPKSSLETAEIKIPPKKPTREGKKETIIDRVVGGKAKGRPKKEKPAEPVKPAGVLTEAEVLAKLSDGERKLVEDIKVKEGEERYRTTIAGLAVGQSITQAYMAKPAESEKAKKEPKAQYVASSLPIKEGSQFTIKFDGKQNKYVLVSDMVAKQSQNVAGRKDASGKFVADPEIKKLSLKTDLGKLVLGQKSGFKLPEIEIEGQKYQPEIRDVDYGVIGTIKLNKPKAPEPAGNEEERKRKTRRKNNGR